MRQICSIFVGLFLLFATITINPASAQGALDVNMLKQIGENIPNLGVVSPILLRGGQPRGKGLEQLKAAGVKTIVNLRDGEKDIAREKLEVERLGLKYVSIPMSPFKSASKAQIEKFISIFNDDAAQPIFVHCRAGRDRTGTMVAIYRLETSDWTADKTYNEMVSYGFHQFFFGLSNSVYSHAAKLGRGEAKPPAASFMQGLKDAAPTLLKAPEEQPG
ncbi:MAG: tyrosine-protein phosphatase [Cyanobacteria bacterium]|nr:tyrosine-protein phosphatase [Cyanobacteriota bacterium]